jgi:hypothetical protein
MDWWKENSIRFPVLSKMAKDYLAIQAASIYSEKIFSGGALNVTKLRNALHSNTVRELICLKSWLKLQIN